MRLSPLQSLLAVLSLLAFAGAGFAAQEIPVESGWSGHIAVGVGGGQAETNVIDEIGGIELGDDRIDGLDQDAGSESFGFPTLQFDLAYTLADTGTQFYLLFQPSPHIFLDLEAHAGIRQRLPDLGMVDLSLSGSAPTTKVWKDPYLTGANRGDTDRSVTGLNIRWHNAMETPVTLEISSQEIEIDDEESGAATVLPSTEHRLLRRTGQVYRYHVNYAWSVNDRNTVTPAVSYLDYQLDGDAMAEDGVALQLSHEYLGERWNFTTTVFFRDLEAGKDNPLFSAAGDREVMGAAFTANYPEPFGWKKWIANARISWYDSDSDIDFYDESLGLVMVGATYRLR